METLNKPLILIIDDEQAILQTLKEALKDEGYRVQTLQDGTKALDVIGKLIPDLILLDIFMPHCNGLKLLEQIKKEYPHQAVILISGFGNIPLAIQGLKSGAIDFIEKPLSLDEILPKIASLYESKQNKQQVLNINARTSQEIDLIGESYTFCELLRQASHLAQLNLPITIYGQSGTGKTTLARFIHNHSQYSAKEFKSISCTHQNLKELETSIKHAFEGSHKTLYFRLIDSLSPHLQELLLDLLETNKDKQLRIVASTSNNLFTLVKEGLFNSKLFNLLNAAPLEIPPLRKHQYDIPLLLNHFLTKANKQLDRSVTLNTSAIRQLRNYEWPGNITQLKQVIEKIVALAPSTHHTITPQDLITYMGEKNIGVIEEQSFAFFNSLKEATNAFEKNFILYLLKKNQYNLEQVSNRLNLTPVQLRNKLLELHIEAKPQSY